MRHTGPFLVAVWVLAFWPAEAQVEPTGPPMLLDTTLAALPPPGAGAVAERGESTLAVYALSDPKMYRLDPHGVPLGPVATMPYGAFAPDGADGMWRCHEVTNGSNEDVRCQRFTRDWAPIGSALTVHSYSDGKLDLGVGSDAAGRLLVAWRQYQLMAQDPGTLSFRLLDASGASMGPTTPAFASDAALHALGVARFPTGGFALVTEKNGPARQLWAQIFDAAGTPGTPLQLSSPPAGTEDTLSGVAAAGDGFAVLWQRMTLPGTHVAVLLQRFGPAGQTLSPPSAFFEQDSSAAGALGLGCDGWGRCVAFGSPGRRHYDAAGAPSSALLPGGASIFGLATSPSGAFTLISAGAPPNPVLRQPTLPAPPSLSGIWSQRYQGPPKGDLDADGSTDIVLQSASTRALELWAMNGTTGVGAPRPISPVPAANWQAIGVDDFDGDWHQDLALWNSSTGAVELWSMGGVDGTTRLGVAPLTGVAPLDPALWRPAATGDFDADGKPDLLWRNEATGVLRLWTLNGSAYRGTLTPNPDQAADTGWRVAAAVDFDNDGRRDLLWYNPASGSVVFWYLDTAMKRLRGQFANPASVGNNNWVVVGAGDFGNGTGRGALPATDLLWRNQRTGKLVVWHMDTAGNRISTSFTQPDAPTNALDWTVVGPR